MSAPTPVTVAGAVRARRAREAAAAALRSPAVKPAAPSRPVSTSVREEVQVVIRPRNLAHWQAWVGRLGLTSRSVAVAGSCAVVVGDSAGVPVRLVGRGVPAMAAAARNSLGGSRV